ncbi:MAG: hypothetical protein IJX08_03760 [Clostridia bacterium]|nr:hypothetical protein [Clostridia bacterium]
MKKYPPMPPELYEKLRKVRTAKEARAIHRELKKYGDGMPFYARYPDFPLWVSGAAVVIAVIGLLLKVFI